MSIFNFLKIVIIVKPTFILNRDEVNSDLDYRYLPKLSSETKLNI